MNSLPPKFVERMERLLGEEAPSFLHEIKTKKARRGLRVNTLKITVEEIFDLVPTPLIPLPWTEVGFEVRDESLGKHPFHAAGLYYLQEPSAMAVSEIVNPQPGEKILDLAAAPGGKTTHLCSKMKNQGLLIANDPHGGRVQALARNLERWGAQQTIISQETPQRLGEQFGAFFDRVLVDAPCSGEGTFRKDPGEMKRWSENAVQRYASLQNEILWYAAQLVKPGGTLVYSTCTFSPYENEGRINQFIEARSDFEIISIPGKPGFSTGNPHWVEGPQTLRQTVRIWPHAAPGEGHFIACLKRRPTSEHTNTRRQLSPRLSPQKRAVYHSFVKGALHEKDLPPSASPHSQRLTRRGNRLYAIPQGTPPLQGLRIQHWGWWLGTFKGDRFLPAHALAMGLSPDHFLDRVALQSGDQRVMRYLRGVPIHSSGKDQWVGVSLEGYLLGWGKRKDNQVKSYSPRWLSQL